MVLYNITYNIENNIVPDWLDWMRRNHIPKMLATGYFTSVRLYRLINVEDEGATYSLQFMSENLEKVQEFLEEKAYQLAHEHNERYKNKHVAFRTVLQEVDL